MITFPEHCRVGKVVAKEKIYSRAKPSEKIKSKFVKQVGKIVWGYKLAPVSLHIPARDGLEEIQVFELELRKQECDIEVLKAIDMAIPHYIFFVLRYGDLANLLTGHKKIVENQIAAGSLLEYFSTGWYCINDCDPVPMPGALDMAALYVELFRHVADLPREVSFLRLEALVKRLAEQRKLGKEIARLEKKRDSEKQFDKRLEVNRQVKELKRKLK